MQTDTGSNVCCYDRLWHGGARHTLWKGLWQQAAGLDGALWHHGSCGGPPVLAGRTPSHPGSVVHCWCCWRWVHLSPWLCLVQFSGENGKSRSYTTLNLPVGLVNVTEFVPAVWFLYIFFLSLVSVMSLCRQVYQLEMCGPPVRCLLCPFVSRSINLKCVGPQSGVCYVPLSVGVSTWNVGGPQWEASQPLNGCSGVCCALLSTTKWLIRCLLPVAVCRSVSCGLLCLIINYWMVNQVSFACLLSVGLSAVVCCA